MFILILKFAYLRV